MLVLYAYAGYGYNKAHIVCLLTCDTEICSSTANLSKYWGPFHLTCLFACESVSFAKFELATFHLFFFPLCLQCGVLLQRCSYPSRIILDLYV